MLNLSRKTAFWVDKGIISQDQASEIIQLEQKKGFFSFYMALLGLGFFSIACGIVALISANWQEISALAKLVTFFVSLAGLGFYISKIADTKHALYEGLLLLYALLFFAGIGLIGQIFHLKSDTYKAFLFWSALSAPLLFVTKKNLLTYIWIPLFCEAFLASPFGRDLCREIYDLFGRRIGLLLSFISFTLYAVLKKSVLPHLKPLRFYILMLMIIPMLLPFSKYHSRYSDTTFLVPFIPVYIALIYLVFLKRSLFSNLENKAVCIAIISYTLTFCVPMQMPLLSHLMYILVLLSLSFYAYSTKNMPLYSVLTLALACRILITFFTLFGTLFATGMGLIYGGFLILGVGYIWLKFRRILEPQMEQGTIL